MKVLFLSALLVVLVLFPSVSFAQDSDEIVVTGLGHHSSDKKLIGDLFQVVEQQPEFVGGTKAMYKYLSENLQYPEDAYYKNIQGKVYVNFVVTKTGEIANAGILLGVDSLLDAEALRVVKGMPAWEPGKQRGEPQNVKMTLPIKFAIKQPETTAEISDTVVQDVEVFQQVEEPPMFPGGDKMLMNFLSLNIRYPHEAQESRIQGRVYVKFVVRYDGTITNVSIAKSVHPILDAEALRVVSAMPLWIPGRQRGKSVNVSYMLPINFVMM